MLVWGKDEPFIDLIGKAEKIVSDAQVRDLVELFREENFTHKAVRRVYKEYLCLGSDLLLQFLPIDCEIGAVDFLFRLLGSRRNY